MVLVACRKEIPLGVRCRTLVNGSGLCSEHAKSENVGGFCRAPDAVEFVLSVNPGWRSRFESAGLSAEPHYAGPRIDYLSEALALGVDPYYYGEAPTSGTAVFDVKGTTNVSIEEAWTEIQALRYDLTRLRLVRRSDSSQRMTDFYATFAIRRL